MKILFDIVFLLAGFVLLIKGADYFVDGSVAIAKKLKIPSIVVGLTIVAVGTSLPELAVSSLASLKQSNTIAVSNVVGSNIFNLLMVLGITALFTNINVKKSVLQREFPLLTIISAVLIFLTADKLWFGDILEKINIFDFKNGNMLVGEVSRMDGFLLLVLFAGFIIWTVRYALKQRVAEEEDGETLSNGKCAIFIIGGILAIVAGGELVVDSAKGLALAAGMSETLVGLTVVALGTSLPELVTSVVAARKGEADLAIGNVVGSNIANILLVLGAAAVISPVSVTMMNVMDAVIVLVSTVIVFIVSNTQKTIKRKEGILLVLMYAAYMIYIICRQYCV